jgi:hypothetical protein
MTSSFLASISPACRRLEKQMFISMRTPIPAVQFVTEQIPRSLQALDQLHADSFHELIAEEGIFFSADEE